MYDVIRVRMVDMLIVQGSVRMLGQLSGGGEVRRCLFLTVGDNSPRWPGQAGLVFTAAGVCPGYIASLNFVIGSHMVSGDFTASEIISISSL